MELIVKAFDELSNHELYELMKIRVDVFIIEQECIYHELDDKDQLCLHCMIKNNDKIVAYARILPKGLYFDEVAIGRVVVSTEYRRNNYGRSLMEQVIIYIEKQMNENSIRISAQEYLENFYASFGFSKVSEMYLEDGIAHIDMLYEST